MRHERAFHEAVWASARPPGREYCTVRREEGGWRLRGTLVRKFQEGTAGVTYLIRTDNRWNTKEVSVEELFKGSWCSVKIKVREGHWLIDGKESADLEGCKDVDLEASPVTNTLPLKRARLKVGERVDLKVAWMRFPSLAVHPLSQSYTRLAERKYRYESTSGFSSEIEVDRFGLVRKYGIYWVADR